jgi:hypothetical protein
LCPPRAAENAPDVETLARFLLTAERVEQMRYVVQRGARVD